MVAIAVDPSEKAEAVRRELHLPFPILCDTSREVVQQWKIFNEREKGGIARPAVFVVDRDLTVRFQSVDTDAARVPARTVLLFLREGMPESAIPPHRRLTIPRLVDWLRAVRNALRFGARSPQS